MHGYGSSVDLLFLADQPLGLVVGGATDKKGYLPCLQLILEKRLLIPNGLLVADNTLYKGTVAALSADPTSPGRDVDQFNRYVYNHPQLTSALLPCLDGVLVSRFEDSTAEP